ncbi:MAG: hypothetical protein R3E83_15365 [Burkholderiaceae bacterium]
MNALPRLTADDEHGRLARWPWHIGRQGWVDILARLRLKLWQDRVLLVAAGVTFYALLAISPGLSAAVSLTG